jgi:hypothetical protein
MQCGIFLLDVGPIHAVWYISIIFWNTNVKKSRTLYKKKYWVFKIRDTEFVVCIILVP